MKQTFTYGTYSYEYFIEFAERKTLGLEVRPDLRIIAKVPIGTGAADIDAFLTRKWRWLEKNIIELRRYRKAHTEKRYVTGETFYYLGRQYMLHTEASASDTIKLERGKLRIYTTKSIRNSEHNKELVEAWFARRRAVVFKQQYRLALQQFDYADMPQLRERAMVRRWGSYKLDNTMYLNPRLIHAPKEAIYYICIHELCHVAHRKHDAAFYHALQKRLPQWQTIKKALELNFG